jgi:hypothetical protein
MMGYTTNNMANSEMESPKFAFVIGMMRIHRIWNSSTAKPPRETQRLEKHGFPYQHEFTGW